MRTAFLSMFLLITMQLHVSLFSAEMVLIAGMIKGDNDQSLTVDFVHTGRGITIKVIGPVRFNRQEKAVLTLLGEKRNVFAVVKLLTPKSSDSQEAEFLLDDVLRNELLDNDDRDKTAMDMFKDKELKIILGLPRSAALRGYNVREISVDDFRHVPETTE